MESVVDAQDTLDLKVIFINLLIRISGRLSFKINKDYPVNRSSRSLNERIKRSRSRPEKQFYNPDYVNRNSRRSSVWESGGLLKIIDLQRPVGRRFKSSRRRYNTKFIYSKNKICMIVR